MYALCHVALTADSRARTAITNAMNEYKRRTCIQFVERTTQKDYINFIQGSG